MMTSKLLHDHTTTVLVMIKQLLNAHLLLGAWHCVRLHVLQQ
jgi:hypothetical protein